VKSQGFIYTMMGTRLKSASSGSKGKAENRSFFALKLSSQGTERHYTQRNWSSQHECSFSRVCSCFLAIHNLKEKTRGGQGKAGSPHPGLGSGTASSPVTHHRGGCAEGCLRWLGLPAPQYSSAA